VLAMLSKDGWCVRVIISWLMNFATLCFFFAELKQLHRTYVTRKCLLNLSVFTCILHIIGNSTVAFISVWLDAWIGVVVESALACFYGYTLYWLIWNLRNRGLSLKDLWYTHRFPCAIWKCKNCGHVNAAIRQPMKCERCGASP